MNLSTVTTQDFYGGPSAIETESLSKDDPVSNGVLDIFDWVVSIGVHIGIALLGIVTNAINAVTFYRIGLNDSITVSFFALSCFDLGVVFFNLLSRIWYAVGTKLQLYSDRVDPLVILSILGIKARICYDITVFITMFIAVQKCCCVAFPFHFTNVFTRRRSMVTNTIIVIGTVSYFIPMLIYQEIRWAWNSKTNSTVLRLYSKKSLTFKAATDYGRNILFTISPIVVVFCLIVFITKLRESVKFRKSALRVDRKYEESVKEFDGNLNAEERECIAVKSSTSSEIRATKAVTLVSIIFVICTLPSVILGYCRQLIPEFNMSGFRNLYVVVFIVRTTFIYLNSALNIFVYCHYNKKFRNELRDMFKCKCVRDC